MFPVEILQNVYVSDGISPACSSVTREGRGRGRIAPGDTIQGCDTRMKKNVAEFTKNTGKSTWKDWRRQVKRVITKKGCQFFSGKIGVTPSVAAAGDTNPSDATARVIIRTDCSE